MEAFTLAAVSLALAVSLFFLKRGETAARSFALVCLCVFSYKASSFAQRLFTPVFWEGVAALSLFALAPAAIHFGGSLAGETRKKTRRHVAAAAAANAVAALAVFLPLERPLPAATVFGASAAAFTAVAYGMVLFGIRRRPAGVEKTRLVYLAVAGAAAALLIFLDLLARLWLDLPPLSDIFAAVFLYLVYAVITHPQLVELKELMARALVTALLTLLATTVVYVVIRLFAGRDASLFTAALLASFLFVIAIEPAKQILKTLLDNLFPDSRDIFSFMYSFDRRLEKEKTMLLEEMAPVLAHEIRNPLGSIKGAAQYLRSEATREEDQRLLEVIIEEVNRLNNVVTQFLHYAKPYNLALKDEDINAVVDKALGILRTSALAERVVIEEELRPDIPLVPADREQLLRVILNIAFNALEAMPEGGKLTIKTRKIVGDTGEAVGISIRDTGPGIRKEDLRNIFKPFFTTKERGVGLGLAICRRIIRDHGGHIRVKSLPGQGSIFYIRLNASP